MTGRCGGLLQLRAPPGFPLRAGDRGVLALVPVRARRQITELDQSLHYALRAFVNHLEREHPDDWPPERHLHAVRSDS